MYPDGVNLSYYKLMIGIRCRSLVVTRIPVRELSPRRRYLTHKNARSTIIVVMSSLLLIHGGKEISADLHIAPRTGIIILDHYFNKLSFELFEWSERLCEGNFPIWKKARLIFFRYNTACTRI